MITGAQLKKIHALRNNLLMDEEDYRAALGGFTTSEGKPVRSSKELSKIQASSFIEALERVENQIPSLRQKLYASPKQIRFIAALWRNVSRAKGQVGRTRTLNTFLNRRFHIRSGGAIPRSVAPRVIKSLRIMNERKREQEFHWSIKEPNNGQV